MLEDRESVSASKRREEQEELDRSVLLRQGGRCRMVLVPRLVMFAAVGTTIPHAAVFWDKTKL